ncbi:carbohydrate ABC transporter permease [Salinispira pacifica]|uniref:Sugar ABC transporter, permease protein n=1 Tax=Salinispira pacifica TaxID=1307761 RepID=V5WE94_9SPIO|nr:sugar ABC transporter permease [Salinispira pacifica]AHC13960.1 sugar ABC transporter, permease protein [Salinispira pacifica]
MISRMYKPWTPYLYLIPTLSILILFIFYPLLRAVGFSFTSYNLLSDPQFIGLDNYVRLFSSPEFYRALFNSLKYFLVVVPVLVLLPLLVAVLVNDTKLRGVNVFRTVYYFPVVTSMVVAGIIWKWMYTERGILNYLFTDVLHITSEPVAWLTNPDTALFAVMVVTIWKGIGYYMVIYLAGLQSINPELYEAATIDGAPAWRQLFQITIPLLTPTMAVVGIMSSMAAMKVFDEVYVMTGGGPFGSTRTMVFEIYDTAFDKLSFGYASAIGVVLFSILFILSFLSIRRSDKSYSGDM